MGQLVNAAWIMRRGAGQKRFSGKLILAIAAVRGALFTSRPRQLQDRAGAYSLKDWKRDKDFGSVGSTREGGRGFKVMNAYALSSEGTPVGLLGQHWWKCVARKKRRDCQRRVVEDKETKYWLRAMLSIGQATQGPAALDESKEAPFLHGLFVSCAGAQRGLHAAISLRFERRLAA